MVQVITSEDIGDGLDIVDSKLVATGGASDGSSQPIKVTIPFGNGEPYDIQYDYTQVISNEDLDRVEISIIPDGVEPDKRPGENGITEYPPGYQGSYGYILLYKIERENKKLVIPLQDSVGFVGSSGVVNVWLYPKANGGASGGAMATVEDEVIHQMAQDGSIRIYKKFSNLPEYVQTNTGSLQSVDQVEGDTIFTYVWLFPETRTKYNSNTGELYEP